MTTGCIYNNHAVGCFYARPSSVALAPPHRCIHTVEVRTILKTSQAIEVRTMLNTDVRSHGQAMFKAIKAGRYDFPSPFWDDIQPGAKDMIGCLLMLDTEKRYTAQQVKNKR